MKTTNSKSKWLSRATLLIALVASTLTHAQAPCDVYDCNAAPGPWTQVGTGVSLSGTNISMSAAGSGGPARYVHTTLTGGVLNNNWVCDFEFKVSSGSGPAHSLVSFTEGSGAGVVSAHGYWSGATFQYYRTHCIEAYLIAPYGTSNPNSWELRGQSKLRVGGAYGSTTTTPIPWASSAPISLGPSWSSSKIYYGRLQRLDATHGLISLFSDPLRTVSMGSQCFPIDPGITGLTAVQNGTFAEGSVGRWVTGSVDNISVCKLSPVISGPTSICASGTGVFTMWSGNSAITGGINGFPGSTGITWSGGSSYSPGPGGISSTSPPGLHNECTISMTATGWISCTINYPCGASVTYSKYVIVNPLPTSVITGPAMFCAGAPILLNGSGSTNETSHRWKVIETDAFGVPVAGALWCGYPTWTPGPAGSVNISAILPCLFPCGKHYKARLETQNSCGNGSAEHIFFVACPPTITVTGPPAICAGSCATLTASGASPFSYVWSPSTGLSCTNCVSPTACPTSTQVYTVQGTSLFGCTGTTTYTLNVNPTPTVTLGPDMFICCSNYSNIDTIPPPTVTGGTGPYSCVWTSTPAAATSMLACSHSGAHTGTTCHAPMFLWPCPTSPITYTMTVTDGNGCTGMDVIVLTNDPGCRMAQHAIDDQDDTHPASIFPNPATKLITVNTTEVANQIFITDAMGRSVLTVQPVAEQTQIDISTLSPGIYFVQIMQGEVIQTERLIIEE